jgi:hypothetical protein
MKRVGMPDDHTWEATRRMLRAITATAALAVAVTFAACAAPAPSPSAAPAVSPGVSPVDSPAPSPGATLPEGWGGRPLYTCGGDERFPPEAIVGQGTAEREGGLAGDALRAFLDSPDARDFPKVGWHRVSETPTRVLFMRPGDVSAWVMVAFTIDASGAVRADQWGECVATLVMPPGVGNAAWWVDPVGGPVEPEATTIKGLIRERACASGRLPEGRVLPPVVSYTEQAVVVVFGVTEQAGGQDCPGNPAFPITIELSEPLGDRVLLDGGTFPPRDATIPVD